MSWNSEVGKRMGNLGLSKRIVTAQDDPSGAALATRMGAKGDSLQAGRRNALGGMGVTRAASGALSTVGEGLGRMRELATRSANGTLSDADRAGLDAEFQAIKQDLEGLVGTASFAGIELFSGDTLGVQVGADAGDEVLVSLPGSGLIDDLSGTAVDSQAGAESVLAGIDAALDGVAASQAEVGAAEAALASAATQASESVEKLARAESRIADADMAEETAELAKAKLMLHANLALGVHRDVDDSLVMKLLS
ncbi:MAG: flagellin [Planctomycetota bacterium]|nr:flagellin [Planctomycetota bacterium]